MQLGSIAEIDGGWTTSAANSGTLRLLRTTDISGSSIDWDRVPFCSDSPTNNGLLLQDGDLVIARTGAGSVGNVALVVDPPPAVHASYLLRVRVNPDFDPQFILFYLQTSSGRAALASRAIGSVIPNLSAARLRTLEIPVETLARQLEVAGVLNDAKIQHARTEQSLQLAVTHLTKMRRQAWTLTLSSLNIRESDWRAVPLGEAVEVHDSARVALNATERSTRSGPIPYYGASGIIDSVNGRTHDGLNLLISEDGANLVSRRQNIAMTTSGPIWANNHIHVVRPAKGYSAEFIAAYLNGTELKTFLTGTAQPKLPLNRLRSIPLPSPDLDSQLLIVTHYERLQSSLQDSLSRFERASLQISEAWTLYLNSWFQADQPRRSPSASGKTNPKVEVDLSVRETYETLEEALRGKREGMSPETLFRAVEGAYSSNGDPIELFYEELRDLTDSGVIAEQRDEGEIRLIGAV